MYLMAWFVLHCPGLMTSSLELIDHATRYVQQFENCTWNGKYIAKIRQIVGQYENYEIYCCFPKFLGRNYSNQSKEKLRDDSHTTLLYVASGGSLTFVQAIWSIAKVEFISWNHTVKPFCMPIWVRPIICWQPKPLSSQRWESFWRSTRMVSFCSGRYKDVVHSSMSITISLCINGVQ